MKLIVAASFMLALHCVAAATLNLVCYYDSSSYLRSGFAKLLPNDLDLASQFCTHLVYGYAGLNPITHELISLNKDLDVFHYKEITQLKVKYPHLKVFLSVGGDRDIDEAHPLKYVEMLESGEEGQQNFIDSAMVVLQRNGFDGLDLAFQMPKNQPRKVLGTLATYWNQFKELFTGNFIVDEHAAEHKQQYTEFVKRLRSVFVRANLSMSMTVLPNVNSTWYYDVPKIASSFDFINLAAFDFLTPERNPEEADFSAPIYTLLDKNRLPYYNIEYQVNYWLANHCPPQKLNLGVASYGRAWKMTLESGLTGVPVVTGTNGPAEAGLQSKKPGLLSWPEICAKLSKQEAGDDYRGAQAPIQRPYHVEQQNGNFALKPADDSGEHGIWVTYDDPDFAGIKAAYAKSRKLGGVALFDLSYDDFRGQCTGKDFPFLREIKYYLY